MLIQTGVNAALDHRDLRQVAAGHIREILVRGAYLVLVAIVTAEQLEKAEGVRAALVQVNLPGDAFFLQPVEDRGDVDPRAIDGIALRDLRLAYGPDVPEARCPDQIEAVGLGG